MRTGISRYRRNPGPDGSLWLNLPAVELWEAIAISCGLEPSAAHRCCARQILQFRLPPDGGCYSQWTGQRQSPAYRPCKLATVAQLAQKCAWTLPPGFRGAGLSRRGTQAEPAEAPRSTATLDMGVPKGEILAVFSIRSGGKPKGSGRRLGDVRAGWIEPGLTRAGEAFNPAGTPPSSPCALRKRGTWGAGRLDLLSGVLPGISPGVGSLRR